MLRLSSANIACASASVRPTTGMTPGITSTSSGVPAEACDLRLERLVEGLRLRRVVLRGEHHVGDARGQRLAGTGGAGLDQHRMALRRARHVQRALDGEILALEVGDVEAARPHELAGLLVADEGAVVPAVPQQPAGFDEFLGHRVALGMRRMLAAEHRARLGVGRGHHVPARPPARDVVERGEAARHVIGLGIGRRGGGGEADPATSSSPAPRGASAARTCRWSRDARRSPWRSRRPGRTCRTCRARRWPRCASSARDWASPW